ncbi:hypothetical protein BHE74_00034797 [Ensete ventricosum]|nr:hypothetical protein BHE74_00034797 [Ensete ventricosum]RZS11249.1 hypothetical protein BHM03_00042559 [Ensete ventricosum]
MICENRARKSKGGAQWQLLIVWSLIRIPWHSIGSFVEWGISIGRSNLIRSCLERSDERAICYLSLSFRNHLSVPFSLPFSSGTSR